MRYSDLLRKFKTNLEVYEELCRLDVLRFHIDNNMRFQLNTKDINKLSLKGLQIITRIKRNSFLDILEIFLTMKAIGLGPKVFRPTVNQLLLMEEMAVNLSIEDYVQPFEVVIFELPEDYMQSKIVYNPQVNMDLDGLEMKATHRPMISMMYHDPKLKFLAHNLIFDSGLVLKSFCTFGQHESLEAWLVDSHRYSELTCLEATEEEFQIENKVRRAILNYCLLLDEIGIKETGPEEPGLYKQLAKHAKKTNKHSKINKIRMKMIPYLYELNQEVILHKTVCNQSELGEKLDGDKRIMPPHHRRGHYRMQPCGKDYKERKRVRIPPVFVNKHLFLGSMIDAGATYRTGESGLN